MIRTLSALVLLACACDKAEAPKDAPKPEPSSSSVPAATASAQVTQPTTAAAPAASSAPAPVASSAPVRAGSTAAAAPQASVAPATDSASAPTAAPLPPGSGMHFDGSHFAVDVASPAACDKGATCTLPVRLSAKDDFHVNKDYPYKIKMDDVPGAEFLSNDAQGKSTFTKAAGDFVFDGEKAGVMTVRFKPSASGALAMTGTLKLSVCNASNCMLEQAQVKATVPVR